MRLQLVSRLVVIGLGLTLLAVLLVVLRPGPTDPGANGVDAVQLRAATPNEHAYDVVRGSKMKAGTFVGTEKVGPDIVLSRSAKQATTGGKPALTGTFTTAWVTPRTAFTQLIPSWRAATGPGTWIDVEVRVKAGTRVSSYDSVARWANGEDQVPRSSSAVQTDDLAKMSVDTLLSQAGRLSQWQIRVTLWQRLGKESPALGQVGAVATLPGSGVPAPSSPVSRTATVLPVPSYSQMTHRGEYPQYGGGGEAWCSPTSISMVLAYYKRLPSPSAYAWVDKSYSDRWVPFVARKVYDKAYQGTGNWPFNTAYAGVRVGDGFVTRLANLRDAERFVRVGIPVVASIAFSRGQLTGAPISSSNGHLLVIVGFTANGDVVVNDPAASSNASVRRTYKRAQFEKVWLQKSLGTVLIVRDEARPLPKVASPSW